MIDAKVEAKAIEQDIIKWRRDLHKVPEIDTQLPQTTDYIKKRLSEIGLKYKTYSNMGISVVIKGSKPGPTIGFRADMDALPVVEETGLSFASKNGNMHACGHDAHAAMLLGAAKILFENRDELAGNVVLIFQPAEETTGGAKKMIEEGCLEDPKVDKFISMHIGSLFPEVGNGVFGVRKGATMASVASFYVKVKGKGGHGARPHECVDPILISAEIIQSLQKLVSREINPVHGAVVTVGMLNAGTIINVIPSEATMGGTIRSFDPKDADILEKRVKEMIPAIARANGGDAEVQYERFYPSTVNDEEVTDFLASCAEKVLGKENVVEISEPSTGTEDVAFYLNSVPGSFGILGSWKCHDDNVFYPHHSSKFHLDESVFWIGTAVFVQCALDFCK